MAPLPRIVVEAFEQKQDGPDAPRRPLGPQDLTEQVLAVLVRDGRVHPRGIAIIDVHAGLAPDVAKIAWAGDVALPDLPEATRSFLRDIGGMGGIGRFRDHMLRTTAARRAVEHAREVASLAETAALGAMPARDDMVRDPYEPGDDYSVFEDLVYGRRMAAFERSDPEPGDSLADMGTAAWKEWAARRDVARRALLPPFAFATRDIVWKGVPADNVREQFANDQDVDVEALLDSGMEEHHDDARDHVVAESTLHRIVEEWLPHAGKGTPEDLALEGRLARWNARQTLSSYEADMGTVVPLFPDVTKDEILAFATREVESAEARLAALYAGWEPTVPVSSAA